MRRTLGREELVASPSAITSATDQDVAGFAVTVETTGRPIRIKVKAALAVGTNNVVGLIKLKEGSTILDLDGHAHSTGLGTLYGPGVGCEAHLTPDRGSHTYKVALASNGSASVQLVAAGDHKAFIEVEEDY